MRKLVLLFASIFTCINSFSQEIADSLTVAAPDSVSVEAVQSDAIDDDDRPKIGLVLSGGGAKGLAHIGVLKAIDAAHLKIDYITGTSMGAILAAMYASGYSGEQIEEIARGMDWFSSMTGTVKYSEISIEEKDDYDNFLVEIPVEKGFKIKSGTGFVEPQPLMLKFAEVFYPVYRVKDFDDFDIPFKCIATDIGTGEAVVLDNGDIVYAVRSSMAIPGVFTTTKYGDSQLVDGGIVRNFPVRDVREMGADYVIGVNLFSGLTEAGEINTMIDVVLQVMNFSDAKDLVEEKKLCDMIIEPDVSAYSSASFGAADELFAIGDSIGEEFYPLFKQLADGLHNRYGAPYAEENRMAPYPEKVRLKEFEYVGLNDTDEDLLMHNLNLKKNKLYSPQELNVAFRKAFSTRYYKNLSYELLPLESDSIDVRLKCNIEENPLQSIKIGLSYNTFTSAAVNVGFTWKNLFDKRSELDMKMALSEAFRLRLRQRFFFGKKNNNYAEGAYNFNRYDISIFGLKTSRKDYIYTYSQNNFMVNVAHIYSDKSILKFTGGFQSVKLRPEINNNLQLHGNVNTPFLNIQRLHNSLDRRYLPQHGTYVNVEAFWGIRPNYKVSSVVDEEGNPIEFSHKAVLRATVEGKFCQSFRGDRVTLIEEFALGATWHSQSIVHEIAVGGPIPFFDSHFAFYGLKTASRFSPSVALGRIAVQYRLVDEFYVSLNANMGATFKELDAYISDNEKFEPKEYLYGLGVTASYNLLGALPFDITLMSARHYGFNVSVNVGIPF